MATITTHRFDRTDPRLGRHQVHDSRSRAFPMATLALPTRPVLHERRIPIFDQGQVGMCTACAGLGMIATGPLWRDDDPAWTAQDALQLYSLETRLDDREIPGSYPPDDTGSAGIYLCKALRREGLARSYRHAFTAHTLLAQLGAQPCAAGIPWYESMFTPDQHGRVVVDLGSPVAGGHEICLDGIDPTHHLVRFANSWGTGWGDHGYGWLSWLDLGRLLRLGGDAVTVTRPA